MDGNSPSITDWIGSIGTAAAFLGAAASLAYDRKRRRKTELLAQARVVDAWLELPQVGEQEVVSQAGDGEITRETRPTLIFTGCVSNSSQQAIRDVVVEIVALPRAEGTPQPVFVRWPMLFRVVPPTLANQPFPWEQVLVGGAGVPNDIDQLRFASWAAYELEVRFTDTAGVRWIRSPSGTLKRTVDYRTEQAAAIAEIDRLFPGASKRAGIITSDPVTKRSNSN